MSEFDNLGAVASGPALVIDCWVVEMIPYDFMPSFERIKAFITRSILFGKQPSRITFGQSR